ncbi:unnamed protein product (macronuclear) [Paramecium tetraurelia]|uniref:Intimal thickness related receptor IRP domain-containing protein n=1 Tax=Paramecium tetraurelia TaxID=5888 RepID=A0C5M8_PARTE|nr:uncharacterized protein GSPATT00035224001 [Paramecium tetraurelia]CAK66095.1 unnamed protein product [Paramecium tetraurelia]|eukprot:XP_001433492.1 hypothetical protein (macronuclear) [Paramecium tetraurelia strain d4-2]
MFNIILFQIITTTIAFPDVTLSFGTLMPKQQDPEENLPATIYKNNQINKYFDYDQFPLLSCCPTNLTKYKVDSLNLHGHGRQKFILPLTITNNENETIILRQLTITDYLEYQDIPVAPKLSALPILQPHQSIVVEFIHSCERQVNNTNYWSIQNVFIRFQDFQGLNFQYQFICDGSFHPKRFDWSNIILITFDSIVIIILATFGKIYSFRIAFVTPAKRKQFEEQNIQNVDLSPFQGFYLYWPQAVAYMGLLLIALFTSMSYQEKAEKVIKILVYLICVLTSFHFFNEIFGKFRNTIPILTQKVYCLKIRDYISILLSTLLIFFYLYYEQPWFVSNLLSICILGSFIKLFKIISLKDALQFFIPLMIIDIFCSIYLSQTVRYEWDSVALRYFNTPLSAQFPYFRYIYKKKCAWVSIFNLLFPGFFLGYVNRFDKHKQTYVYEIIAFFGLLLGLILWVLIQFISSFPLPTSIFTEVLMILATSLVAVQRNEFNIFYSGNFYDQILMDPFKNDIALQEPTTLEMFGLGATTQVIKRNTIQQKDLVQSGEQGLVLNSQLFAGLASVNRSQQQSNIIQSKYQNHY